MNQKKEYHQFLVSHFQRKYLLESTTNEQVSDKSESSNNEEIKKSGPPKESNASSTSSASSSSSSSNWFLTSKKTNQLFSQDFSHLVNSPLFHDVVFIVDDEEQPDQPQRFFAHRSILSCRSEYFRIMFSIGMQESHSGAEIHVPEVSPALFLCLLTFLYTGKLKVTAESALPMLALSNQFAVEEIKQLLHDYMRQNLEDEGITLLLLEEARTYQAKELFATCRNYVEQNSRKVFSSPSLGQISQDLLIDMLQWNELRIFEIEIFKFVVEWAKAQINPPQPFLPHSPSSSTTTNQADSQQQQQQQNQEKESSIQSSQQPSSSSSSPQKQNEKIQQHDFAPELPIKIVIENEEQRKEIAQILVPVFEHVRFPLMSPNEIRDIVEPSKLVPQHLILEAYKFHSLFKPESPRCVPRIGLFNWDESKHPPDIIFSNMNRTVTLNASGSRTVVGTNAFTRGRHYWEVIIDFTAARSDTMIGVVDISVYSTNNFLSHNNRGWAIYGNNGSKYHNSSSASYATPLKKGDVVGVFLDLDRNEISFFINGVNKGVAFSNVTGPVYPAVTLYALNDKLTLDTFVSPPWHEIQKNLKK